MPSVTPFSDTLPLNELSGVPEVAVRPQAALESLAAVPDSTQFDYLFPELQKDPLALLPTSASTVQALKALGDTMTEPGTDAGLDSNIPSVYAHFGQFVDHDITMMLLVDDNLSDPNLTPLPRAAINNIRNLRTPSLDLDNVYGEAPHAGDDALLVGTVFESGLRPPGKDGPFFDLPRQPSSSPDPRYDRAPRIGDKRDDETTIIGQLHVAFLRAHNAIVQGGYDYVEARSLLRRYYQLILVHDFLPKVADPKVVAEMLAGPWPFFNPGEDNFFMPLEFSAAAFRFGHSMVREFYNVNVNFKSMFLLRLFNVLGGYPRLPESWIVQWENFVEGGSNRARFIDTQLAVSLHTLPGMPPREERRLAVRTLLRSYQLSLPTGQAVAGALKLPPAQILTSDDIEAVAARIPGGAQLEQLQKERVTDDGMKWKLSARTPLWFYILAEAVHCREVLKQGQQLGPVGSRLVAGVLIALVRRSKDSILRFPGWPPTRDPGLKLSDLLRLAGVL